MPKRKKAPGFTFTDDDIPTVIDGDESGLDELANDDERADTVLNTLPVNQVTKTLRVQQVAAWLLDGHASNNVVERGVAKWRVSERTVKRYISVAKAQIEAASAQELRSAATLALYRLTELYFAALQSGDLKTALDVVKAQNRMLGLNAPEKFETKTVTEWNSWSVAEQLNHVASILEKANSAKKPMN